MSSARATSSLNERLAHEVYLLALIDRRRKESGSAHLGSNIERMIIDRELEELESTAIQSRSSLRYSA